MSKTQTRSGTSALEQEREALQQKALDRPGIPEVMKLYGVWQEQNKRMSSYRWIKKKFFKITTTNRTSVR